MSTRAQPHIEQMTIRSTCRGCAGGHLEPFLDLGQLPLANAYLRGDQLRQPEPTFPLVVYFCRGCTLVQLVHVVDPTVLFSTYLYRTGTNQTIAAHNDSLADAVVRRLNLGKQDLVVEIASNDGSLLQCFRNRGVRTVGIEPARNIAQLAREAGIETLGEFFNAATAAKVGARYGKAAAILANNVLAHVDETVAFLVAAKGLLSVEGRIIIEVPYVAEMLDRLEYDTIYHEHLCYFSVTALLRMFSEAGLAVERVDRLAIHGGSLRLWARHAESGGHGGSALQLAAAERQARLDQPETYHTFGSRVRAHRSSLRELLARLKAEGKTIVGYGAPAKGNTLLCYCGLGTETLSYTVDRSPLKIGLYTPGTHIPIVPVDRIFADQPDYVLILAWNFAEEIVSFLAPYKQRGGRFILPVPHPSIAPV